MDDTREDSPQESPEPEPGDERQRLAQLEQEVARLRSRLGPDPEAAALDLDLDQLSPPDPEAEAMLDRLQPSRTRAIIIALAMGLLALGVILGLTATLTDWLDTAADSAAQTLVPEDLANPPAESSGAVPKPAPAPAKPNLPRVPGL